MLTLLVALLACSSKNDSPSNVDSTPKLSANVESVEFIINHLAKMEDLLKQVELTIINDTVATITSASPWLSSKLQATQGSLNTLQIQLVPQELMLLTNGAHNSAIYIETKSGLKLEIAVILNKVFQPSPAISIDGIALINGITININAQTNTPDLTKLFIYSSGFSDSLSPYVNQEATTVNPWLSLTSNVDNKYSATLDAATLWNLQSGQLNGEISIISKNKDVPPITVPITVLVDIQADLVVTPEKNSLALDLNSSPLDLDLTFTVSTNLGTAFNRSVDWTAVSESARLMIQSVNGDTGGSSTLSATLNPSVTTDPNGAYNATIRLQSTNTFFPEKLIEYPYIIEFPQIEQISPYIAISGQQGATTLIGKGFSKLSGQALKIGNNNITNYMVKSDKEVSFTYSGMIDGEYFPVFTNNFLTEKIGARYLVVPPTDYTLAELPSADLSWSLIYDNERKKIYALRNDYTGFPTNGRVERHSYINGQWVKDSIALPYPTGMGMTTDGRQLIVVDSGLVHIDLDTFAITHTTKSINGNSGAAIGAISTTIDGNALVAVDNFSQELYSYDVATYSFTKISNNVNGGYFRFYSSGNGKIVYVEDSQGSQAFRFNAIEKSLTRVQLQPVHAAYNFDGSLEVRYTPSFQNAELLEVNTGNSLGYLEGYCFFPTNNDRCFALRQTSPIQSTFYTYELFAYDLTQKDVNNNFIVLAPLNYVIKGGWQYTDVSLDGKTIFGSGISATFVIPNSW